VFPESGGQEKLIALLTATLMIVQEREGVSDQVAAAEFIAMSS
jgi:hypothetical protein